MRLSDIITESEMEKNKKKKDEVSVSDAKSFPTYDEKKISQARQLYEKVVKEIDEIGIAVKGHLKISLKNLEALNNDLLESLGSDYHIFSQLLYIDHVTYDLGMHCANVAIIAYKIGVGLGYEKDTLKTLLFSALVHDLGMAFVPREIVTKPGRLTKNEYAMVKRNPDSTYGIIRGAGSRYNGIADIIVQVYEREDGSGYPRGLKGDEIHVLAKVIGIADVYNAMVHSRADRGRIIPFEAVKRLIAHFKSGFPLKILRATINELSAFPIGIYVKLNTKEVGRVIATNPLVPLRPTIEILYDTDGMHLKKTRVLDLSKHHLISIVQTFFKE